MVSSNYLRLQRLNPVLDIELRQRSRSRRSIVVLTAFLVIMILVSLLVHETSVANDRLNAQFQPAGVLNSGVGRQMFEWVLFAELGILLLIVPGISAGAISGERDRQTLVPLQVTMIGPWGIFFGKVLSSSSFILLLVISTFPVVAVPYLVGGISLTQVMLSLLSLLVLGFLLAVMGVACSAIFKRTQIATLVAYALSAALTVGTLIALVAISLLFTDLDRGGTPPFWPLYANPFVAVADAAGDLSSNSASPFSPIKQFYRESQGVGFNEFDQGFVDEVPAGPEPFAQPAGAVGQGGWLPLWMRSLGTLAVISLAMSLVAVRKLKAPRKVMAR